eukprot:Em0022g528a
MQQSESPIRTIEGHGQFVAPDCQEHTSTATMEREHEEKGRPTLREILSFSSKTKTVNLAQQIGIRGIDVGVHLLEDDSGARVEGIAAENRSIEDTNRQILKQWLQGSGMKPVAWSTLTKAMRKAGLFDLAAEVDDAMNAEERKVPSLLPISMEYVDVADSTVPECATVWCSAKAEYTQYPHGSRQDCWAIVSVKALRITTRQHVDIVAVIDNSGSMAGMKIQLVKETLLRLIHLLDERDRIALLTYNTSVKQHFALQEATAENKQIFQNAISSIIADGRTNLCDGLMKGIEMLAYNRGTKSAPVQSVLLLSDGEATEGVTVCEKIIKEMNQVECYSGSVYTFAFGNDCNHEMMEAIASHGKGVCYFIDSLEKGIPIVTVILRLPGSIQHGAHCSFIWSLPWGLKTTVAQNLSLHIEMQEDNRINTVHCHDAVQWLKEDKICNLSIQDIQCGEEKCVALTLILPRLMEEKADTVLKGTLSFLDTGSSENKLQDFQLHLQRADRCCSDSSDYQVDQQRNRILAIEAINNLKKSGNCQKARNHMSELINTISVSVSNSSPWTQNLIRDLKECMALFPEPIQAKQRRKHQKSTSLKHFPSKISYSSSQHEQTNILLDLKAYDLSEEDNQPKIEAHSYQKVTYSGTEQYSHRVPQMIGSSRQAGLVLPGCSSQQAGGSSSQQADLAPQCSSSQQAGLVPQGNSSQQAGGSSSQQADLAPQGSLSQQAGLVPQGSSSQQSGWEELSICAPAIDQSICAPELVQSIKPPSTLIHCRFGSMIRPPERCAISHSTSDPSHYATKSSSSDSECSEESNEDQFLESSGALALNSMLHALIQQRSNRVGACMFQTEAKDEMQRKILE